MSSGDLGSPLGAPLARDRAKRLLAGRGRYVDDVVLPRTVYVAFVRSPYPHARIAAIDIEIARTLPGVVRIVTGAELADTVDGWRGEHRLFPALRAPEQRALAMDVARFQGEAVAAVLAVSRATVSPSARQLPGSGSVAAKTCCSGSKPASLIQCG